MPVAKYSFFYPWPCYTESSYFPPPVVTILPQEAVPPGTCSCAEGSWRRLAIRNTEMTRRYWLATFLIALWGHSAQAQSFAPPSLQVTLPGDLANELNNDGPANYDDDILRRLQRAEARLAELEGLSPRSPDAEESSWIEHFVHLYDPEIAIAREQSYQAEPSLPTTEASKPKKWFEKLSIRGYAQFRINEEIDMRAGSAPAQYVGDRSIGADQSFLIRRARVIISGDVHERLYVYLQPDFVSTVPNSNDNTFYTQIRDWYGDFYLDLDKIHRLRVGQSKIPYGWENLQSSSNRISFDRNDALNSAVRNERDLGVIYYWTPIWAQDFFKEVLEEGLKGSGNYGVFGIGLYNGQGGSLLEQNDNLHLVSRLTLPITLSNCQRVELGVQGYYGEYAVIGSSIDPPGPTGVIRPVGTVDFTSAATQAASARFREGWQDKRIAGTMVWYPQPIGFQTEWTVGEGPALNAAQTELEERSLRGGYGMLFYKLKRPEDCWFAGTWLPYVRYGYFQGGYKSERNAPFTTINEWEFGAEWQITPAAELTLGYLTTDRTNTTANGLAGSSSYGQFQGDVFRAQFQINY